MARTTIGGALAFALASCTLFGKKGPGTVVEAFPIRDVIEQVEGEVAYAISKYTPTSRLEFKTIQLTFNVVKTTKTTGEIGLLVIGGSGEEIREANQTVTLSFKGPAWPAGRVRIAEATHEVGDTLVAVREEVDEALENTGGDASLLRSAGIDFEWVVTVTKTATGKIGLKLNETPIVGGAIGGAVSSTVNLGASRMRQGKTTHKLAIKLGPPG